MSCPGKIKKGGGCSLGQECIGHARIDCLLCGIPVADHPMPLKGYCNRPPERTPREPKATYNVTQGRRN